MRPARFAVAATTAAVLLWPASQAAASASLPISLPASLPASLPVERPAEPAMPILSAAPAVAGDQGTAIESIPAVATSVPSTAVQALPDDRPVLAGLGAAVGEDKLDATRGGAEIVVNDMRLDGAVANNTANRVITGSNAISDGAFANASGLPTVIQNTGANTLIQNATILNVRFGP